MTDTTTSSPWAGRGTRIQLVAASVFGVASLLGLVWAISQDEPPKGPSRTSQAKGSAPDGTPAIAPSSSTPPAELTPPDVDALVSAHHAPALGLALPGGLQVDVDPITGVATVLETDASLPLGLGVRRARTGDASASGLFGRGWRSEIDATLHALPGDERAIRRVDGVVMYTPVQDGVWVSVRGEVEHLVRTPEGYEVTDPAGRLHRFDGSGRLVELLPGFRVERSEREVRLVGGIATLVIRIDAQGRAEQVTGSGVDLSYGYDVNGELTSVRGTATRKYGARDGRLTSIEDGRGPALVLAWDADGRIARIDGPARTPGWTQGYTFGRGKAEVTTPLGAWRYQATGEGWRVETPTGIEHVDLDEHGRLVSVRRADGSVERIERDARGRIVGPAAPAGVEKDPAGRAVEMKEAAGTTRFARDEQGRLSQVTTAGGRVFRFERDASGALIAEDGPGGRVAFERDAHGLRSIRRDAAGLEVRAVRGPRGEIDELVAGDGSTQRFERDSMGRLLSAGSGEGEVALGWDDAGRLTSIESAGARVAYTQEVGVERAQTPWGELTRTRDAEGRVVRFDTPAGTFRFELDASGRRKRITYPNGVTTSLSRDLQGAVTRIEARSIVGPVLSLALSRGPDGRVLTSTRDGRATQVAHDAAGRISGIDGPHGARSWTQDADGVRLSSTHGGVERSWRFDARGRAVGVGDETLEPDAAGRLVRRTGDEADTRFGWDAFGRLVEVVRTSAGTSTRVTLGYDGVGRVATRTDESGTTRYVYERGQRLAEVGPGNRVRVWLQGPGTDEPLAYRDVVDGKPGGWVFLHTDPLGTVLAYTDGKGAPIDRATLDPWGEVLEAPGSDRPIVWAGRPVDVATGLVDLRARFYAPDMGRFLSPDPLGVVGGPSPWAYADGRPLERRDPLGLWPWSEDEDETVTGTTATLAAAAPTASTPRESLLGWLLFAATRNQRVTAANALDAGRAAMRDARLSYIAAGFVDRVDVDRPYASPHASVNFAHDSINPFMRDGMEAIESAFAFGRELVAIDGDAAGTTAAANAGYREAAFGYGRAMERGQARSERILDTFIAADHSALSAGVNTTLVVVGEVIPGRAAWELQHGIELDALIDEQRVRRLTGVEKLQRGAEIGAELLGAGASGLGKVRQAARGVDAALTARRAAGVIDDVADTRRATGAVPDLGRGAGGGAGAPAGTSPAEVPVAPGDGLAQGIDAGTARGATDVHGPTAAADAPPPPARAPPEDVAPPAGSAPEPVASKPAPAPDLPVVRAPIDELDLAPDCCYVLDANTGAPVRIGNFVEDPEGVLRYLRQNPTAEILVSDLVEARKLKHALRHVPDLPQRPRIFAADDLPRAKANHAANGATPAADTAQTSPADVPRAEGASTSPDHESGSTAAGAPTSDPPPPGPGATGSGAQRAPSGSAGPELERYPNGNLRPPHHSAAASEPTPEQLADWLSRGREGKTATKVSEARAAHAYSQQPGVERVVLGEERSMRELGASIHGNRVDGVAVRNDGLMVPFEVKNQKVIGLTGESGAFNKFDAIGTTGDMDSVSHFEVIAHTESAMPTNHRVLEDGWLERCVSGDDGIGVWERVTYGGKPVRVVRARLGRISID